MIVQLAAFALLTWNSADLIDNYLRSELHARAERDAPLLNAAFAAPMLQRDYATVQAIIVESRAKQGMSYLIVCDAAGRAVGQDGWPAGAPKPDIGSAEALKNALLTAKQVLEADTMLVAIGVVQSLAANGAAAEEVSEGAEVEVVLDQTPFYPEGGGQVGDTGTLDGPSSRLRVIDTYKAGSGLIIHRAVVERGVLSVSDQVAATMDWLPTLLSAAGGRPDPAYPSDGIDLLPMLTGAAPVRPRTLFWRFKGNAQRAVRDGNMKYLKMLDNTFLFDVVADPMERADLKQRRPVIRIVAVQRTQHA